MYVSQRRLLMVALVVAVAVPDGFAEAPAKINLGPTSLAISVSRTAHLFHVVDQLAEWSPFCHRQYHPYFEGLDGGFSKRERSRT